MWLSGTIFNCKKFESNTTEDRSAIRLPHIFHGTLKVFTLGVNVCTWVCAKFCIVSIVRQTQIERMLMLTFASAFVSNFKTLCVWWCSCTEWVWNPFFVFAFCYHCFYYFWKRILRRWRKWEWAFNVYVDTNVDTNVTSEPCLTGS